jgi:hypothetical protein
MLRQVQPRFVPSFVFPQWQNELPADRRVVCLGAQRGREKSQKTKRQIPEFGIWRFIFDFSVLYLS